MDYWDWKWIIDESFGLFPKLILVLEVFGKE